MISEKVEKKINEQIQKEMYSAYLYMALSTKASLTGYKGVGVWFMTQYHEEMFHAMKFYNYLLDQGAIPVLQTIDKPEIKCSTIKEWFELTLAHEKSVTESIHALALLAEEEKDYATRNLLAFYVTEQIEEEKNVIDILTDLSLLGGNAQANFMLNIELGKRSVNVQTDFSHGVQ